VNAITKSGTNQFHGSAFYLNRNKDWAEDNAFDQKAAPTQQQFGGSIGGPLAKGQGLLLRSFREAALHQHPPGAVRPALHVHSPTAATQEAFNYTSR
jgi:hypothetical protein